MMHLFKAVSGTILSVQRCLRCIMTSECTWMCVSGCVLIGECAFIFMSHCILSVNMRK